MLDRELLKRVKTPCVVLMPHQAKGGRRLPSDLPVVVYARYMHPGDNHGEDRIKLLRWLHMFVTLATLDRKANAPVYVAWQDDTLEEVDLDTCPHYEMG